MSGSYRVQNPLLICWEILAVLDFASWTAFQLHNTGRPGLNTLTSMYGSRYSMFFVLSPMLNYQPPVLSFQHFGTTEVYHISFISLLKYVNTHKCILHCMCYGFDTVSKHTHAHTHDNICTHSCTYAKACAHRHTQSTDLKYYAPDHLVLAHQNFTQITVFCCFFFQIEFFKIYRILFALTATPHYTV